MSATARLFGTIGRRDGFGFRSPARTACRGAPSGAWILAHGFSRGITGQKEVARHRGAGSVHCTFPAPLWGALLFLFCFPQLSLWARFPGRAGDGMARMFPDACCTATCPIPGALTAGWNYPVAAALAFAKAMASRPG
jgi:hypothetical protein